MDGWMGGVPTFYPFHMSFFQNWPFVYPHRASAEDIKIHSQCILQVIIVNFGIRLRKTFYNVMIQHTCEHSS